MNELNRWFWVGVFCALGSVTLNARASASSATTDSLMWNWVALDSAAISIFSPLLAPEQITATRWTTDSLLTNGFGSADISNALNALPGVMMETRGMGGSRRLNVRGSALRSPFAVRNTMLFVRGFMLTEADGTSPVEWLDPAWSGNMELVSGAAATTFGGAYGGALVVHGASNPQLATVQTVLGTTGSGGLQARLNAAASIQGWNVRMTRTQNSGYRDQEWNRRWQFEADRAWGNRKAKHYDWVAFQDGSWGLPGAITEDDSATSAPGLTYDAQVRRRRALWGHHLHIPNLSANQHRSSLDVWGLVRWTDKTNPFGTSPGFNGYKEESGTGASLRVRQRFAKWNFAKSDFQAEWTLMAVADRGDFALWDSAEEQTASEQIYDLNVRQSRAHWAPALSWAWQSGWRLEASAALSQRIRRAQGTALDTSYLSPFNTTQVLPRLGVSKSIGDQWNAFAQISTGFSDPTNFEALDADGNGNLPAVLNSEGAWTLESGVRHPIGELVLYHQTLRNAILEVPVDSTDNTIFVNADSAIVMQGIEWTAGHAWAKHRIQGSGSFQFHRWSKGDLPGSPRWMLNVQHGWMAWERQHQWNVNTWIRAVGATPLNDDGDAVHPAYATLNLDANWTPPNAPIKASIGVRNATNTQYSGWHRLNGFGGKFYNPAPPRTWYVSAIWTIR